MRTFLAWVDLTIILGLLMLLASTTLRLLLAAISRSGLAMRDFTVSAQNSLQKNSRLKRLGKRLAYLLTETWPLGLLPRSIVSVQKFLVGSKARWMKSFARDGSFHRPDENSRSSDMF